MRFFPLASFVLALGYVEAFVTHNRALYSKQGDLQGFVGSSKEEASYDGESVPGFEDSLQLAFPALNRRETLLTGAAIMAAPFVADKVAQIAAAPQLLAPEALVTLEAGDTIVRNIWLGRLAYPTLIVALEMGIFEALKNGPLSLDTLGTKTTPKLQGASRTLEGVSSVLASLGLVKVESNSVALTESARMVLLQESPFYWGSQLLAADGVTASLRRRILLESRHGDTQTIRHEDHSDTMIDSFTDSMQAHSAVTAEATAVALSGFLQERSSLLDMAGGSGCFAKAIKNRAPNLEVILADLPRVVEMWQRKNGQSKIKAVSADLFDKATWPGTCDCVLLANVLHDWGEDQVQSILRNAYDSLPPGGQVVVIEQLLSSDRSGPLPASLASISMLLGDWRSGKQYSFNDLKTGAEHVGFQRVELGPKCGSFHHAVLFTK